MVSIIFKIIIGILVFDYLFERVLDYLNSTKRSEKLPKELKGIYDEEKYRKSQAYERETGKFGLITSTFNFIVMMLMLFLDGFAYVDGIARGLASNPAVVGILFFGILMFASSVINIPFSIYSTFVIEEKYGFNKTTPKTFVLDLFKGWLVGAIIGGGLLYAIIWFYTQTGTLFWLWTWGIVTVFSVFMNMFYSTLIVPLFNKQTPLESGELRDSIEAFSKKAKFKLDNIFVIDGSKRSTKANAYFSGIGPKKRVVLYDTLIKDMNVKELVAVLAHEIGHFKKKHIIMSLFIGIVQTGLMLFVLSLFIGNPELSQVLGVLEPSFHIAVISFGILFTPLSFIIGIFTNILSRTNEYAADKFAKDYGLADSLMSGLKKLSVKNLSNLTPHPAYVFFHYSHPPLLQRLKALVK